MPWTVVPEYDDYATARSSFEWDLPETYNPAVDLLRKHEDPASTAIHYEHEGVVEHISYGDLVERSSRLASALADLGIERGDRVGVVVPQRPANPIAHLANWTIGAVSVPLTVLFGPDALAYRLQDSGARAVVVDPSVRETVDAIRPDCPDLEVVVEVGDSASGDAHAMGALLDSYAPAREPVEATPSTPTAIMYTSGSTGPPKGVLHSHALWLGRAAAAHTYFEQGIADATLWTPADWAWGAALGGTLFAAFHHGAAIVAWPREGFDPEGSFSLMERHGVTHSFMPPTALRMLMSVDDPTARYDLSLETLASAGEPLTPEVLEWVQTDFEDVSLNEFYGQTELNLVVGNCSRWFDPQEGSMGRPLPGYEVAILDEETREELPAGEVGEIAVRPGDERVFFEEYWGLPEKTAAKRTEDGWYLTGDLARREEGCLWFVSRTDDVILTSGYRVGPTEVEEAILEHEAVEQVGVIGVPDETRGEAIAAYVQPVDPAVDEERVRAEIQSMVRERLAAYEYPRQVTFVAELPTTSTGKIRRQSLRERG